jgi:hypothetical protein
LATLGGVNSSEPPFSIFTSPSVTSDFTCFAANITGPGVVGAPFPGCTSSNNYDNRGLGIMPLPVARGAPITASVPAGSGRRIDIYGMYPAVPSCGATSVTQAPAGYLMGSTTVDLSTSDATVNIPVSFSASTASSFSCTSSSNNIALQPTSAGGDSSTCGSSFGGLPGTPAFAGSAYGGSAFTTPETTEVGNENSVRVARECLGSSSQAQIVDYVFDSAISGVNYGNYTNMLVVWKGRAGYYAGACPGNDTTNLANAGAVVTLLNYNGGTILWDNIGTTSATTGGTQEVLSASFSNPSGHAYGSTKLLVRVYTSANSVCGAVYTDSVKIILN